MRCLAFVWIVLLGLFTAVPPCGWAQEVTAGAQADRGPRFLLASAAGHARVPVDIQRTPSLRRRISVAFQGVALKEALAEIGRQAGVRLFYSGDVVPVDASVHFRADNITVAGALSEVLLDAGVDVLLSPDGRVALVKRVEEPPAAPGTIVGRVTDGKTQTALPGATVIALGINRSTTTGSDGRYRIADVAPGTYTVRARYIGYAPGTASVTVSVDQEATADFTLEKSAQRLDEVVTTGTALPAAVKAIPTPVSVITDSEITLQRPRTMQQVLRQAVPTMVAWELGDDPTQTAFSVRGASTIGGGSTGQMKVFVDGIPMSDVSTAILDPASIGRVEVIRGPQAAAIYGSDAVGGVIQVFTKHGDSLSTRPAFGAEAAVGIMQTPYAGYSSVVQQSYRGSVSGGAPGMSYHFGAGYTHTPDFVAPVTAQSTPSVDGAVHVIRGILTADLSARYFVQNDGPALDPTLAQTGFPRFTKPYYLFEQTISQSTAARVVVAPTGWWQHSLTLGVDRLTVNDIQTQPRLSFPGDTLLHLSSRENKRPYIAYNTSVQGALSAGMTGSLTLGFDHYNDPHTTWFTDAAANTVGSIVTPSDQPIGVFRTVTNNTGYFAQAQLGIHDALYVTGGVRAEQNTSFGQDLGTPVSPQVGISYVRDVGMATVKLRGSWGRAIRPPGPTDKDAGVGQLANPKLAPERQRGWDTGVDVEFGARGSLSATYFNQTAEDLLTSVLIGDSLGTTQNQNVGRVTNRGVELEGTVRAGPVEVRAQYGYVRSRVEDLGPTFTGDLAVGDVPLTVPTHTAGVSMTVAPVRGPVIALGLTYVGNWRAYDTYALFSCFGGTGPCLPGPGFRNYIVTHPHLLRLSATVSQRLTSVVTGVVSVDNLTNSRTPESSFTAVVKGRITTVALQLHR